MGVYEMTKGLWVWQAGTEMSWITLAGLGWGAGEKLGRGFSGMGRGSERSL